MSVRVDAAVSKLTKFGEEVCGDTTELLRANGATTCILSDGLGSGIKASILSIMTTKIVSKLLRCNVSLDEVFATLTATLPTCKVRGLAYSTLAVLKVDDDGEASFIEYDNPLFLLLRDNKPIEVRRSSRVIRGKEVNESRFKVKNGDVIVVISDGVTNAGIGGGLYKLGLGLDGLLQNVVDRKLFKKEAHEIAQGITDLAQACYLTEPGDDSTAVVLKVRQPRSTVVLTGPPVDSGHDSEAVHQLIEQSNVRKVVCGGATGNMVARELERTIKTSIEHVDPSVPPTATIEGIDLVTEGILTLNKCVEKIKKIKNPRDIEEAKDGATLLAKELMQADNITFLVGNAINPAHEELMRSLQLRTRSEAIKELRSALSVFDKNISVKEF